MAQALCALGKRSEAMTCASEALTTAEQIHGQDHPITLKLASVVQGLQDAESAQFAQAV